MVKLKVYHLSKKKKNPDLIYTAVVWFKIFNVF